MKNRSPAKVSSGHKVSFKLTDSQRSSAVDPDRKRELKYIEILEQFFIDVVRENNHIRDSSISGALDVSMVDNIGEIIRNTQDSLMDVKAQPQNLPMASSPTQALKTTVVDGSRALDLMKYKHRVDELELKVRQLTEEFNEKLYILKSTNKALKR